MGGGTDLRSGFRWFVESSPTPVDALIVLTDGETPWPNEDEALSLPPTITIITPNGVKPPAYMGSYVQLED
jgi:predicted metal-dependent peptidase